MRLSPVVSQSKPPFSLWQLREDSGSSFSCRCSSFPRLGIETVGGIMTDLIKRNTTVPTKSSEIFSTYWHLTRCAYTSIGRSACPNQGQQLVNKFKLSGFLLHFAVSLKLKIPLILMLTIFWSSLPRDKTTGKSNRITITNDTVLGGDWLRDWGSWETRYWPTLFARRCCSCSYYCKNGLESYAYNLRNSLADNFDATDKSKFETAVNDTFKWLDTSQEGLKEEYEVKQKEFEAIAK